MNARQSRAQLAALSLVLLFLLAGCGAQVHPSGLPSGPGVVRLTLLHTNDTHGHLQPFSYPEGKTGVGVLDSMEVRRDLGGIARRAALAKTIRAECAASGVTVELIDAGDFCDGTPFSTEYHGTADLEAMNACGYDYGTFGNHEYNNSLAQVRTLMEMAQDRVLCANVVRKSDGRSFFPCAYDLKQVGPLKVGFFGLTTEEAGSYPAARDSLKVLPPIETARAMVDTLRKHGADVIVLVSHCGTSVDRDLADQVPGICAIVGGHSHSRLPAGKYFTPTPDEERDPGGTIVVQAHQWGGELGRLDLAFQKDQFNHWAMTGHRASLISVTAKCGEDPAVKAVVDKYWDPIKVTFGEEIGTATDDFTSRKPDRAEYNLVADAIRDQLHVDFDLENLGGVRSPLVRGTITLADLVNMDPFNNTVVTFKIKGKDLKALLLRHEPAVSGIRYRITDGDLKEATINGAPIEDEREYTGATNSYFAGKALKSVVPWTDSGKARLQTLVDYIKAKKDISPQYDGRRVVGKDDSE